MMKKSFSGVVVLACGALLTFAPGGCPSAGDYDEIRGSTGDQVNLAEQASVEVFAPQADLAIAAGSPVEVNWRAIATTVYSVIDVFLDVDSTPDNGNETVVFNNLPLTQSSALLDTSRLPHGTYWVGVAVINVGEMVAHDYATGRLILNEAPTLVFDAPRGAAVYDRSLRVNPTITVSWTVSDPDSTVSTAIFLDPDATPNGNEVLLRRSGAPADTFSFDLPTANFEAGTYRILAVVTDGVADYPFYAPATFRLRGRTAGYVDLRDMHLPQAGIAGAVFEGFNPRDNAGSFLTPIYDIDGDGFGDFIIIAQFGKPGYGHNLDRTGVGEGYLIYGRRDRFSGTINLNSTGTLYRGEFVVGVPEQVFPMRPSRGITCCTLMSDWDGDGVRELAFGMPYTDSQLVALLDAAGYFRSGGVVIASTSSLRPDLGYPGANILELAHFGTLPHLPLKDLPDPPCPEGFWHPKAPASPLGDGSTYFHEHFYDITDPEGPVQPLGGVRLGARLSSVSENDNFGEMITTWGDQSIVIGAPNRDPSQCVTAADVLPGAGVISTWLPGDGFAPWTSIASPPSTTTYPGLTANASRVLPHGGPYHYIIDDIRISPQFRAFSPGYTVDLDDNTWPDCFGGWIDANLDTPPTSIRFWSQQVGARLSSVSGLGDVNGDGQADLAVGAPFMYNGAGAAFIVFGRLRSLIRGGQLPVEELALPMEGGDPEEERIFDGIRILGAPGERLGLAQDSAGDFDGDGFADILFGSPLMNDHRGGAAVFFGGREIINLTEQEIPFHELPQRELGVIFVGEDPVDANNPRGDMAGARVRNAGDVDGDGYQDIMIAAPHRSVRLDLDLDGEIDVDRTDCGVVYVIYGSPQLRQRGAAGPISLSLVGTSELPGVVYIGRESGAELGAGIGLQEDRSFSIAPAGDVDGDGNADLLLGSVRASPRERAFAGEVYLLYGSGD